MQSELIYYVRDKYNTPTACVMAVKQPEGVGIGWSMCGPKDAFSKAMAKQIARGRAASNLNKESIEVPDSLLDAANHMIKRASRYFKEDYHA